MNAGLKPLNIALKAVFAVVLLGVLLIASQSLFMDGSTWHHSALGKEFVKDMGFPRQDSFSYTGYAQWDKSTWLFDILAYTLVYALGPDKIYLFKYFLYIIFCAMLYMIMFKRQQGRYISATLPFALAGVLLLDQYFKVTPGIISCVYTAYFIFVLENEPTKRNAPLYYSLPFIALFWANTAAVAAASVLLLLIYVIYYTADYFEMKDKKEHYFLGGAYVALFATALAVLLNPSFYGIYLDIYYMVDLSGLKEWKEYFTAAGPGEKTHLALIGCYLATGIALFVFNERGSDPGRKSGLVKDTLLLLVFLFLTVFNREYLPVFLVISIPVFTYYAYLIFRWSLVWPMKWTEHDMLIIKNCIYAVIIPLAMFYGWYRAVHTQQDNRPELAVNYLLKNPAPQNLFTPVELAGYAEQYLYPQYKVMYDGGKNRTEEAADDYARLMSGTATLTPVLAKYDINSVLTGAGSKLSARVKELGFKTAYFDGKNVVLVNPGKTQDYLKYINPENPDEYYDKEKYNEALAELTSFAEKNPSEAAHLMLAKLYAERNGKKARAYLEDRISEYPSQWQLYNLLGKLYYGEGEFASAVEVWDESKQTDNRMRMMYKDAKRRSEPE
ncbi:MAG: hypothetical protein LLG37_08860 [Spirochaetia bacterium]|nr:hypothetical protein [Spirochaetia bacterium]